MGYSAEERATDFKPLPPEMGTGQVRARDVKVGDWLVFMPEQGNRFERRVDWVMVTALEADLNTIKFKAPGYDTIKVPADARVDVGRLNAVCSVRKYVGEGRDRHSVDVCRWTAGHDGKHQWEYEDEEEDGATSGG